ncbi:MAG: rhomboid family intramembrane serine protease [Ferruginibacter sp.]
MAFANSRTTPVVLNLIIINVLVFIAQSMFAGNEETNWIFDFGALHHYKSDHFQIYQIITHMFMHGGFFHLLFNMFVLWMFGTAMEKVWGSKTFIIFYLICGIFAALTQLANYAYEFHDIDSVVLNAADSARYQLILSRNATVGASGAIMGILAAFGYTYPDTKLFIMPIPFPIKAKWAILGIIALDVFGGVSKVAGDNVAHFAHLGGAVAGFILVYFWNKNRNKNNQNGYFKM